MRYLSDDGKVFDTEHDCCEYEQHLKKSKSRESAVREGTAE